ncbi:MAG TPA: hypothetical protein VFJ43_03160 [Bacteroidia bacterium]|nr:hypothetical protein [Bacteroidia bacterium]
MGKSKINYQASGIFVLLIFLTLLFSSCGTDWKVYETSEFSIEFPGIAKDTVIVEGNAASPRYYFEPIEGSLDSNMYYSISLYSLPDSVSLVKDELNRLYKTDVQIYAWSIGGELADSGRVVKSGNIEGREYKVVIAGNRGISTVRKFAVGKHLYTLLVVTENMKLNNKAIRKFLDSFKLKKETK